MRGGCRASSSLTKFTGCALCEQVETRASRRGARTWTETRGAATQGGCSPHARTDGQPDGRTSRNWRIPTRVSERKPAQMTRKCGNIWRSPQRSERLWVRRGQEETLSCSACARPAGSNLTYSNAAAVRRCVRLYVCVRAWVCYTSLCAPPQRTVSSGWKTP